MTNIEEVIKKFNERFYNDFDGRPCFTNAEIKSFISEVLTQQEELHRKELEKIRKETIEECLEILEKEVETRQIWASKERIKKLLSTTN
jgi:hypothetical protein